MPLNDDIGQGTYVGEKVDGKRHGQGTFTLNNGTKYVGNWKNDLRDGEITEIRPNGKFKRSMWINGKRRLIAPPSPRVSVQRKKATSIKSNESNFRLDSIPKLFIMTKDQEV